MTSPTPDDAVREALVAMVALYEADEGFGDIPAIIAAREALAAFPSLSAPEGWKLVPVEAKEEMILAGHAEIDWCRDDQDTQTPDAVAEVGGEPSGSTCREDLQSAYAAMLAAAPAPPVHVGDGWRPIEEAPKDGTLILIGRQSEWREERRHVVWWDADWSGGWWMVHDGKSDHPLRGAEPTVWQHLPPPPTEQKEER